MPPWEIISAPTNLGLHPGGVERLGEVLLSLGLEERVGARVVAVPARTSFEEERDPDTGLLNVAGLAAHVRELGGEVAACIRAGGRPLVLGGDDSVLIGAAFGLRQLGRFGLLFLDAHVDFYPPTASPTGEASDSDLALVTGFGPDVLGGIGLLAPYVRPGDVVAVGRRDLSSAEEVMAESEAFAAAGIRSIDLRTIRERGAASCARDAAAALRRSDLAGIWIHLDCDVLEDRIMPAVDYRLAGGLTVPELVAFLRTADEELPLAGMSVSNYNPNLDEGLVAGRVLVSALSEVLAPGVQRRAETRIERIVGAELSEHAVREWPQSGELLRGRARIAEVESHFEGLKLALGKRYVLGDRIVVEWSTDYGDGRVYRNVTIAELRDGRIVRLTDYWGEPFTPPEWRHGLSDRLGESDRDRWPPADALTEG